MRTKRRLALGVLLAAIGLAAAAFPFRATWWGGWILAIAEAGIVGGLADWFAVTAIFRRPLGLPIPHTGLIPRNWELLAARVGTMVGDRVLTREYLAHELARLDLADLAARAAERLSRAELESVTRAALGWVVRAVPVESTGEITGRLQRLLVAQPVAPMLARGLELARQHDWDQRAVGAVARVVVEAMERPELRGTVEGLVDEVLSRYRERMPLYPRLALGLADVFGLISRERIVTALRRGLEDVARDPGHPLRGRVREAIDEFAARLRHDPTTAARVETVKADLLGSPVVARLAEDAARAVRRVLLEDLERPQSEALGWLVDRLERWRRTLVADSGLRHELDRWVKERAQELVDRHHGRIAVFIEKGVHALGPEGAVRLIEEHAGDDLQYIRVNGTVVGGLAGGLLYAIHLLIRWL